MPVPKRKKTGRACVIGLDGVPFGMIVELARRGIMSTMDVLGESVKDRNTAEKAVAAYLELLDVIKAAGSDAHISLKLTQQGLDIDTEYCYQNVRRIIQKAGSLGTWAGHRLLRRLPGDRPPARRGGAPARPPFRDPGVPRPRARGRRAADAGAGSEDRALDRERRSQIGCELTDGNAVRRTEPVRLDYDPLA